MTKVQLRYELTKPLDDQLLPEIAKVNGVYGIERISISNTLDRILVEYDATRLNPMEVEAVLHKAGLPIRRADAQPVVPAIPSPTQA